MTAPRILRLPDVRRRRLRERLTGERAALARAMARLRRALHAVEKRQEAIVRAVLARLEDHR